MKQIGGDSIRVVHPLFQEDDDGSTPISPLQFEVSEVSVTIAMILNSEWHSRLPKTQKGNLQRNKKYVFYAAFYKNMFYATAIWTSPIARSMDDKTILELRRFAISEDAPKNTASRMLAVMRRMIKIKYPDVCKLISYQDTEVHKGTIYAASGWKIANRSTGSNWKVGRKRNDYQASGEKIRWEYDL